MFVYYFTYSILRKIPELQEQQKLMIEDWNDKCLRFEKSLKKTEETLKDQISVGKEVRRQIDQCDFVIH